MKTIYRLANIKEINNVSVDKVLEKKCALHFTIGKNFWGYNFTTSIEILNAQYLLT